jgi:anti-sigma regulatory factor (Ser/Thr protein kinase)
MAQTPRIELRITSDPANLSPIRKQVEAFALAAGMPVEACDGIGLALNEALANVIRHGYGGATDKPIAITAGVEAGEFRMTIRDWAKPFDPATAPQRQPGAEAQPGGLGLLCMRKMMDDVRYQQLSDGMLLTMVRRKTR